MLTLARATHLHTSIKSVGQRNPNNVLIDINNDINNNMMVTFRANVLGIDLKETLTRAKFEELNKDLFKKCAAPIKTVLDDSDTRSNEVDQIVLVGGSTRIPYIRKLVKLIFKNREPATGVNPDEAVAFGAAVQASRLLNPCYPTGI